MCEEKKEKTFCKIFLSKFCLELQCLVNDFVNFLQLSMLIKVSLP